ncbi:MAG: hypothetical protein CMJ49_12985 [Planctomycetaceae bacterium]|nr:hypothetical protein [Planctomycetaceae bacterium]
MDRDLMRCRRSWVWSTVVSAVWLCVTPGASEAGARRFTYSYEALTHPRGEVEYEQWVTWKTSKRDDRTYDRLEFRHELEFGVTDDFQLGVYVSDWRYTDGNSVKDDGADWRNVAVEGIYNLTHPIADPLGLSLYGEVKLGDELFELEAKLLLEKDFGPWALVYNPTIEAEWEGDDFHERKGKFEQTAGISYQVMPQLMVGAEVLHEISFDEWSTQSDHAIWLGPNVSYWKDNWWITVTPLFQTTHVDGEPDFQLRMLIGIEF